MRWVILISIILIVASGTAKDIELVLHKNFLQKLIDNIFPITLHETYSPDLPIKEINEVLSFSYETAVQKPCLSIHPEYIQIDATIDWASKLGSQSFPATFRFIPVFNPVANQVEFKVIQGEFRLLVKTQTNTIDLGNIDISHYISNIKIPLEFNTINVSKQSVKPKCTNVSFQLLKDRIIVSGEVVMGKG